MSQASSTPQALASERQAALAAWALASLQLAGIPDFQNYRLMVASDDASFRRYFRATSETHATDTYILSTRRRRRKTVDRLCRSRPCWRAPGLRCREFIGRT
jgi:hypothetical protein